MSLIGGYVGRGLKFDRAVVEERTDSFHILPGERDGSYTNRVWQGCDGHLVAKFKEHSPAAVRVWEDSQGNQLLTLGYMNFPSRFSLPIDGEIQARKWQFPDDFARLIEECEGEFVAVYYDHQTAAVHIINDRFASRPFYVTESDGRTYFSSNIAFLVHLSGISATPDILGWLQIFSYSHTLDQTTNFDKVKRLRPATHLVLQKDKIQETQYWRLVHQVRGTNEPESFTTEIFEAFRASTARCCRIMPRGFVTLSGGLDSRLVAATLPQDANYFAFTFGKEGAGSSEEAIEVETAGEVARVLGLEHRVRYIPAGEVSRWADDLMALTGGLIPLHHPTKTMQTIELMKQFSGFQIGGGPGDILAGSVIPSVDFLRPEITESLIRQFCLKRKKYSRRALALLFRRDLLAERFGSIDESIIRSFESIKGDTAAHRLTAWAMAVRQPAFTFTSPIHNDPDVAEAVPHLGYAYNDLMLQLPAAWLFKENFYSFMIYHCLPQLRDIIYANTGKRLVSRMQNYQCSDVSLALHSLRNQGTAFAKKILPDMAAMHLQRIRDKGRKTPNIILHYYLLRNDKEMFANVREIVHSFPQMADVFDIPRCFKFLTDFETGRRFTESLYKDTELLGTLATACYWYRYYGSCR